MTKTLLRVLQVFCLGISGLFFMLALEMGFALQISRPGWVYGGWYGAIFWALFADKIGDTLDSLRKR